MDSQSELQQLFPGEHRHDCLGIPVLSYARLGDQTEPLVVFLTGGGVLARIVYGHPQGRRSDFLDYWLEEQGWGLLTASYPGDHPVFPAPKPDLQLEEWASALAELVAEAVGEAGRRPIIACGWSMGGKLVFALTRELRLRGIALTCFVSLCATPPFPRLNATSIPPERLHENGLWDLSHGTRDGTTRDQRWNEELALAASEEGRTVVSPQDFSRLYRCNAPSGLWGPELDPYFDGGDELDIVQELRNAAVFSGHDYPICVAVVPTDRRDYRHALADEAVWGGITVQCLLHNRLSKVAMSELSTHDWVRLRESVIGAPRRLTRHLPGGHFFFLGAHGARATVAHLVELHDEVQRLESFFGTLNCPGVSHEIP